MKQTTQFFFALAGVFALIGCRHGVDTPAAAQVSGGKMPTRWDKDVSATSPLPEYPRPQMLRGKWLSLNGPWDYALSAQDASAPPAAYAGKILVPYPYESALSGVGKTTPSGHRLWYRRSFVVPSDWREQRVLLHFGAVNWDSMVSVNGRNMMAHKGGFDPFEIDITGAIRPGQNEIVVSAWNPVIANKPNAQVIGKQRLNPGGIFYTAATGIWQTVWLEPVAVAAHITRLKITPDLDAKMIRLNVEAVGAGVRAKVTLMDGATPLLISVGDVGKDLPLTLSSPHVWTPDDPHLYSLKISLTQGGKAVDTVYSYAALRKISLGKDTQGRQRIFLNNKFVFEVGALDQGYWPDGIYTAPTDAALKSDIEAAKGFGFNLLRKHAKVEPDRWYYWADRLGVLVWQDMPQAFGDLDEPTKKQWMTEWEREIASLYSHPSIVVWTTFNEGWGQHDTEAVVAATRVLDPTRLINNASGWTDKKCGDILDTHAYPGPWSEKPEATRAAVNGEFGGVTMSVDGHRWNNDVMGYGSVLGSGWLVTKRYQDLLKTAYQLKEDRGTSAVVYTQLTDVEQEINGLMTYDRAIVKPDAKIVAAANKGEFLALPPDPNPPLVPTSQGEGQEYRYTTDQPAGDWAGLAFDVSSWKTGKGVLGHNINDARTEWTTADIWARREVTLPTAIPAKLVILAVHDEDAEIYVNGVLAASVKGYSGDYAKLPMSDAARAALKPGKNVLAVHCHNTTGGQGIDVGIEAVK
ncbi:glycoside hydrolase family 2 protein [Capsulimonas corticalis]|nr:sugar-binding domain-containing protein [Capsulimonas corticalis]